MANESKELMTYEQIALENFSKIRVDLGISQWLWSRIPTRLALGIGRPWTYQKDELKTEIMKLSLA